MGWEVKTGSGVFTAPTWHIPRTSIRLNYALFELSDCCTEFFDKNVFTLLYLWWCDIETLTFKGNLITWLPEWTRPSWLYRMYIALALKTIHPLPLLFSALFVLKQCICCTPLKPSLPLSPYVFLHVCLYVSHSAVPYLCTSLSLSLPLCVSWSGSLFFGWVCADWICWLGCFWNLDQL